MSFDQMQQVVDAVDKFQENQKLRFRSLCLRSEAVAGLPFIRDCELPIINSSVSCSFQKLNQLNENCRRQYGKQIFLKIIDYLRALGVNQLFVKDSLLTQVLVRIERDSVTSVQLCPEYLGRKMQPFKYIEELRDFLFSDVKIQTRNIVDFLYPRNSNPFSEENTLENCGQIVQSIRDIKLQDGPGKVFICDGQVLSTQTIFESMRRFYINEDSPVLWIILARFVNEHQAVNNIRFLPTWLNEYVKYKNPRPLNETYFVNLCIRDNPLEMLRIVLGMSPKPIVISCPTPYKQYMSESENLPLWYQHRLMQLTFISHYIQDHIKIETDGVQIKCPLKQEQIMELVNLYE